MLRVLMACAGLAATSMVFRQTNATFATRCLLQAQALYVFATNNEGKYSDYGIEQLYPSTTYLDDLAFAAAWMYKATGAYEYLADAHEYWDRSHKEDTDNPFVVW